MLSHVCNISSYSLAEMAIFNRAHYFGYFLLSIVLWTVWSFVMLQFPEISTTHSYSRGIARIASLLLPASIFLYFNREYLNEPKLVRGIITGLILGFSLYLLHFSLNFIPAEVTVPTAGAVWLNWIIGSPFAEEVFFRGIVLRQELKSRPSWMAILISAVAFGIFHLPSWIIVQHQTILELATNSLSILVYGIIFGIIYWSTRSIAASFIPHVSNNLIAQLIKPL